MNQSQKRQDFADFLDRLAQIQSTKEEWELFCVEPYADDVLEDVRQRCVQLSIGVSNWGQLTLAERDGFQALATELRHSTTRKGEESRTPPSP
jgi:hypothetical protein